MCTWCPQKRPPGAYFFCACEEHKILPPDSRCTYFDLFGMSRPVFDLDVKTLEGEYKSLQKQLHPDKFAQRPPEEQKLSAEQASVVNVAYDTLTEPLSRALYIMKLRGCEIGEGSTVHDTALLMEQMEVQEEVDEAGGDAGRLEELRHSQSGKLAKLCQEMTLALGDGDDVRAKGVVTRMMYVTRTLKIIEDKLVKL
eukprot:CAMPEP_0182900024 /NCGR_PEP_ID=MMETSP0034_2-20130328/28500_1 /TAXON_ID=156128 /ORGANISM="Nephroselmis pyriformis, Strain CCMP717" /LENGTH=196 /DNA_ID=CAMNT_0025034139 /DNA_START=149 /DNA_END=739 /DNA_ORIENTATION=+